MLIRVRSMVRVRVVVTVTFRKWYASNRTRLKVRAREQDEAEG